MTKAMAKYGNLGLSMLVGIGLFLFWYIGYPHALSYQEQYQLFLWTGDYFLERVSVPGGFADWLGEFIVQFYYVEWLGALLLALLIVIFGRLAGWIPAVLLLWLLGDPSVLLGYVVSLVLVMSFYHINRLTGIKGQVTDIVMVPIIYWIVGPLVWIYVGLRILKGGVKASWLVVWTLAIQLFSFRYLLPQWTLEMTLLPALYYRIPMMMPTLMWLIPIITVIVAAFESRIKSAKWLLVVQTAIVVALAFLGINKGYDKDMYELICQDYLVRNEKWDEIIKQAEKYQVHTPFSSVCVNLALSQKRELADRMFDFYQSGSDALIMPRIRDLTSMLPSAETFWRLGMINSSLRYFFDTQESILNGRSSGRCTKRIAECMLVNGHYKTARKHLDLLKNSLFYRSWAKETEALMGDESSINAHPVYGTLRQIRYKNDFLYSHFELYKMFGLLFMNNTHNKMALDYFMGQMLLEGQLQGFQQYMGAVQQYGGYSQMPVGYRDALICIQKQGAVPGSHYAAYVNRMMAETKKKESDEEAH